MAVDKDLFLYDLAVVAIMKNEGPYIKEWLDYHLLAGVDHFYIYDNDSPDNMREVLQPYIDAGIVTYTFYPGKCRQMEAYIDAVHRFKYFSRYMAFIDGDEFIFPQNDRTITEVVDEVFQQFPSTSGLVVPWKMFGSNYQEKADYSRGVLERFTRCRKEHTSLAKSVLNPRKIMVFHQPHSPQFFEDCHSVNENGGVVIGPDSDTLNVNKIRINHYKCKSREEYAVKVKRGRAEFLNKNTYSMDNFTHDSPDNEVFDDSILKYVESRKNVVLSGGGGILETLAPSKQGDLNRLFNALMQNLSSAFSRFAEDAPAQFFQDKMETYLTCLGAISYLRETLINDTMGNALEESALNGVYRTFFSSLSFADIRLLISDLPQILTLPYPVVKDIRNASINLIPQFMNVFRVNNVWREFTDLEHFLNMLKAFDVYERK